jgi:glycerol dehydrogenase
MLEKAPEEERSAVLRFCCEVGLPVCFADMGYSEVDHALLRLAAEKACVEGSTIHNMPFPVTSDMVYAALLEADAAGRAYRAKQG